MTMRLALYEALLRIADGSGGWCQAEAQIPLRAMSEEQLKAFMEAVKADADLQEKVNGAGDDPDAVLAIAKSAGFVISAEELKRAQAEVSEDELAGVAGGSRSSLGVVLGVTLGNSSLLSMGFIPPKSS